MGFGNPIVGGTALRIPAIQSPNYVPGSSGWIVKIDGSAEFNNLTVRGQFQGTDFIVNSAGIFLYSAAPAAGNLIGSWTSAAGTDAYGNAYVGGLATYAPDGSIIQLQSGAGATMNFTPQASGGHTYTPGQITTTLGGSGQAGLEISSGATNPNTALAGIALFGTGPGASLAEIEMTADVVTTNKAIQVGTAVTQFGATWQTPSLGTGWASGPSGGSFRGLRYRIDAEDNLILSGVVHTTSATPSATLFTLPAGYRPAAGERPGITFNKAGTYTAGSLQIATTGVCTVDPVPTVTSQDAYIYATVPLGNIQ